MKIEEAAQLAAQLFEEQLNQRDWPTVWNDYRIDGTWFSYQGAFEKHGCLLIASGYQLEFFPKQRGKHDYFAWAPTSDSPILNGSKRFTTIEAAIKWYFDQADAIWARVMNKVKPTKNKLIGMAEKTILGNTIVEIRYLSKDECDELGWAQSSIVLVLNNGTILIPSQSGEGGGAGSLIGQTLNGKELSFPPVECS